MSLFAALSEGLQVTVIGLLIVFSVLIILMLVLMLMKVVFYKKSSETNGTKMTEQVKPIETTANEIMPKANADDNEIMPKANADDAELVAVLTAAISASLNTSTYNLKIKSFKRVSNTSPAWQRAGLNEVINSRF